MSYNRGESLVLNELFYCCVLITHLKKINIEKGEFSMIKLIVVDNYEQVSDEAFKVMKEIVTGSENPVLGLATGSSPIGLYKRMVEDHKENNTSYKNVVTFNLDEYLGLPVGHKESYFTFMHENLFDHIDINPENIHIPMGNATDIEEEAVRYETEMRNYTLDVQLLGVGSNGHIGFNEPGESFDSLTHTVTLQEKTRKDNARFFDNDINQVPTHAISMGIASIMRSKKILLVASGENKADAICALINGEVTVDWPCTILQNHDDVVAVIDKAAASKL